ncbi:hypothetical protein AB8B25_41685, partial [Streptomyces sp. BF23-30]
MRALVVTAVAAEADSVTTGLTPHPDTFGPEPRTLPLGYPRTKSGEGYLINRRDLPGIAFDVLVGGVGGDQGLGGLPVPAQDRGVHHLLGGLQFGDPTQGG